MFTLHKQLEADTFKVCDLKLCRLLLMNDQAYPWVILVPREENISEITDLSSKNQQLLMEEISQISNVLQIITSAEKMNIAALGNVVPQLHIHIIARFKNDPSWPAPIWGKIEAIPYTEGAENKFLKALQEKLT